jgi:ribonuclease HII
MERLAVRHPAYGWDRNAGYGTEEHREAIKHAGVTPHHRRSFTPVLQQELF